MAEQEKRQKKIAMINDLSGYGRCSLTVALPIISHLKVQCCPLPTAILSNHTGFPDFYFEDFTEQMKDYISCWKRLGLCFDGICTGFLGSKEQIEIVKDFIGYFKTDNNLVVIDPIMGDYGKPYSTYTPEMCHEMKRLLEYADILTPNLTEACILTNTPYQSTGWKLKDLTRLAKLLCGDSDRKLVITGIPQGTFITNMLFDCITGPRLLRTHRVGTERSGTGDVFSSIIAADAVNGIPFDISVKKASNFVKKCITKSIEMNTPQKNGVCFEEVLYTLH